MTAGESILILITGAKLFDECGLTMEFYASRKREYDEVMPWDHLDYYISKEFLVREKKRRELLRLLSIAEINVQHAE